ncbi:hypothetical protein Ddye_014719 [Dipteronia dyeriana]|uniref:Zinc knuckle CX2CX4HX4C domain-containing protein n=1 Tax=Dipteronia dyeriana TaxID=168575 RepID=A0AAD9X9C7_9ROSI|nr:hypothetical protein Ddye_014719 [Dipteronia dyeriana]
MVGGVMDVDVGLSGECSGKYLRVRIRVDVNKPIRRCLRVDVMGDGVKTVMIPRYERLPNHCFRCGRLGHATRERLEPQIMDADGGEVLPYGVWLKATALEKCFGQRNRKSDNNFWRSSSRPGTSQNAGRKLRASSGSDGAGGRMEVSVTKATLMELMRGMKKGEILARI